MNTKNIPANKSGRRPSLSELDLTSFKVSGADLDAAIDKEVRSEADEQGVEAEVVRILTESPDAGTTPSTWLD